MKEKMIKITIYGTIFNRRHEEFWHPRLHKHCCDNSKAKLSRTGKCILVIRNGRLVEIIPIAKLMQISGPSTKLIEKISILYDYKVIEDGWCLHEYSAYTPDEFLESVRSTTRPRLLDNSTFLKVSPKYTGQTVQILAARIKKGNNKYLAFVNNRQIHVEARHPLRYSKWTSDSSYLHL